MLRLFVIVFFVKQKAAYEMRISDWSSDVCSSDLRLLPGSSMRTSGIGFHSFLQLLAGTEGHHGPGRDRDFLAGLRVAAGPLVLAPQVEIAEARQLDLAAALQRLAQGVKEIGRA